MRHIFCLMIPILLSIASKGQHTTTISGAVIDQKTSEPLPYASIIIKNTTIGTMANADGKFVFHVPAQYQSHLVQISMLGYETNEIPIANFKGEYVVKLKVSPTMLKELVVRDLSAKEILKRAFKYKRRNYPEQPFQFEGYYREVQKADGKGVALIEAFALIGDDGYQTTKAQQFKVKHLRIAEAYTNPVAPFWENKNLLVAFVNQNFVKYSKSYRQYKVARKDDTMIDGVLVYVLEIDKRYSLWPSQIYIRSDNYAIIRTEENFDTKKDGLRRWKVDHNPMVESFPQAKTLQISYRYLDGKYYPENYRMYFRNIYRDVVTKKDLLQFEISQQFVVTKLITKDLEAINPDSILSAEIGLKKLPSRYNAEFWQFSPIKDTPVDSLIRLDLHRRDTLTSTETR